ncbi:MAG: hypothetical protein HKN29_12840, partial [Rhodothermales bacterium]|nr:hypothetical protein [Rhodothermales bacterium]
MHSEITETFAKLLAKGVLAIRADAYFQFRRQTGESYETAIETAAEYLHVSRSVAVRRVNDAKAIYAFLEANG